MRVELRLAGPADADRVFAFLREFTAGQAYTLRETVARRALGELLADPALGRVWLILAGGEAVGYAALAFGYSLEHGGRDAILDELFVAPHARGQGLGRAALAAVLAEAERLGLCAVHLEVERANASASRLYRSLGFASNDRQLLTRKLGAC
jgi:ribosomal protein S18 acetylase RimI-like enzyme